MGVSASEAFEGGRVNAIKVVERRAHRRRDTFCLKIRAALPGNPR
jgi:hypothetical protein